MKKSKQYLNDIKNNNVRYDSVDYDRVKPKGKLKEVAEQIEKLAAAQPNSDMPGTTDFHIHAGHLLDGVRCNGMLKLNGIIRLKKDSEYYDKDIVYTERRLEGMRATAKAIRELIDDNFVVCPECHGSAGELLGPNFWDECGDCDGQGMLLK